MISHIGRIEEVLLEEEKMILGKRYMIGHTPDYIPVAIPSNGQIPGDIVSVTLSGMLTDDIMKA
jgi:threonylcarbamoyladenosine tRNA methylthiotransferase MtaB